MSERSRKVVFLGPKHGLHAASRILEPEFELVSGDSLGLGQAIQGAVGLIDASMRYPISEEIINLAENLRIISTATTGSDHIDKEIAAKRNIQIRTLREDTELLAELTPAAEHTWALLLALARNLVGAHEHVLSGGWDRLEFPGLMLRGKVLGLVGCGRIGQRVGSYGAAFGMRPIGVDPHQKSWPSHIESMSLDKMAVSADVISAHVHLNSETKHLISAEILEKTKPGVLLINTSRGAVVDESALLDGLRSGHIGGAAIDVMAAEPAVAEDALTHYAKSHSNLLITPHVGGYCPEAVDIVCSRAASKILDFFG
jgi:phosphoglycerate dehydrogenase-like enzyme